MESLSPQVSDLFFQCLLCIYPSYMKKTFFQYHWWNIPTLERTNFDGFCQPDGFFYSASVLSTALIHCFLNRPLSPQRPSVPSMALCPLRGPMSSLRSPATYRPPVPSMALGTLYCPLSPLRPFSTLFPTSDNHDNCNNRSCDKREIAIIDLTLQHRPPNVSPIGLKFSAYFLFLF
jgi:hypothetical protein